MSHVSMPARASAAALATALVAAILTLVGSPAHAADTTVDGITYSEVVMGDPSAGATVTGYAAVDNPAHPAVTIPASVDIGGQSYDVVAVGDSAFNDAGLTDLTLPGTLTELGANAFSRNALTAVDLPAGLTLIGAEAFMSNDLAEIAVPGSVTRIERAAFYGNVLTTVQLSSGLEHLGLVSFAANELSRLRVPASVTTIGESVVAGNRSLSHVTFAGPAPTYEGDPEDNPIAPLSLEPDATVRYYLEHEDTFSWPTWHGVPSAPIARVSFADPVLGTPVPGYTIDLPLDQGTDAPFGYLDSYYDSEFDLTAPEGYALAGWSANGEPWEVGDPIDDDTVLSPLWIDTTTVRSVVITPSATEVEEGESITLSAEGFNALGDSLGDVTADMEFRSDVPTDVVTGATVTFPTASPHTITGLYLPLELAAEPVVIEVLAAEAEPEPTTPDEEPTTPDEEPGGATPGSTPVPELAATGVEGERAALAVAVAMVLTGGALVALRRRIG